ncbi:RHS repeat-associated core domain-containing protein [Pseudomonas sp. LLC-1]|uniref:RHS repeat-associated core domain-containing protein n=1 Tax=Pseudomonas sp. LLC-1 TaxID=1812180 RepID=UPI0035326F7C
MTSKNAYSPYGYRLPSHDTLGFSGEYLDPVTGHSNLGNGYRGYNHVLMRFNCPDSLSPFAEGGFNAYAYCQGDPVNFLDPSGHFLMSLVKMAASKAPSRLVPSKVKGVIANNVPIGLFNKKLGWHGTKASNLKSFVENGIQPGHSKEGRQLQGAGFYFAADRREAEPYAQENGPDGAIFEVLMRKDVSLVPYVGYTTDDRNRVLLKEAAFDVVIVRETAPENATSVKLRPAPYTLKKK